MKYFLILSLISSSLFAGIYVPNLWPSNEVEVCFAPAERYNRIDGKDSFKIRDWSPENKALVKNWVDSEYTKKRTGIRFVGWKNCMESPRADVVLFYNNKSILLTALFGGSYIAGRSGALGYFPHSVPGYAYAANSIIISKGGMEKGSVIHEFGHVAGLGHEHIHPDAAKNGRACDKIRPSYSQGYQYTPYDESSIMSYCSLKKKATTLSKNDLKLLKKLYR